MAHRGVNRNEVNFGLILTAAFLDRIVLLQVAKFPPQSLEVVCLALHPHMRNRLKLLYPTADVISCDS